MNGATTAPRTGRTVWRALALLSTVAHSQD